MLPLGELVVLCTQTTNKPFDAFRGEVVLHRGGAVRGGRCRAKVRRVGVGNAIRLSSWLHRRRIRETTDRPSVSAQPLISWSTSEREPTEMGDVSGASPCRQAAPAAQPTMPGDCSGKRSRDRRRMTGRAQVVPAGLPLGAIKRASAHRHYVRSSRADFTPTLIMTHLVDLHRSIVR
jgi:hypothetical protein